MTTATAALARPQSKRFAKLATWWHRLPTWKRIATIVTFIAL